MSREGGGASPLLAWPPAGERAGLFVMPPAFLAFFYAVFWPCDRLAAVSPHRTLLGLPGEAAWPVVPVMAAPYLSVIVALGAVPWILRSRGEAAALYLALAIETLVAAAWFVAMPAEAPIHAGGVWGPGSGLLQVAERFNGRFNYFPSLHVAYGLTAAARFSRDKPGWMRGALAVWAVLAVASTVLTREHHILDAAGGAALAIPGVVWALPWCEARLASARQARS